MEYAAYFRAKAVQCRYLADIANNLELRERLDELALEFERKAGLDSDARVEPPPARAGQGG